MAGLVLPLKQAFNENSTAFEIDNTFYVTVGPPMSAVAIAGTAERGTGVIGSATHGTGVNGSAENGVGVVGSSGEGTGIQASSNSGVGLQASSGGGNAINATSTADIDTILATSSSPNHAAVSVSNNSGGYGFWASSTKTSGQGGIGIYAKGAKFAGQFDGQVIVTGQLSAIQSSATYAIAAIGPSQFDGTVGVTGTLTCGDAAVNGNVNVGGDVILTGADCAEEFEIAATAETGGPGTVMILTDNGALQPSKDAYDRKVAGVISGAGDCRPALILGRRGVSPKRGPLALVGKVYCKADAQYGSIEIGDLLTTSPTPGHAMRAADPSKAFGAVIGKALRPLRSGQGLVPIIVALQ